MDGLTTRGCCELLRRSENVVADVFTRWTWTNVFEELGRAVLREELDDADALCRFAEKMSARRSGVSALEATVRDPAKSVGLADGFASTSGRVREMACALSKELYERSETPETLAKETVALREELTRRIATDGTRAASAASAALLVLCRRVPGALEAVLGEVLRATREKSDGQVKARGMAFAASAAAMSADAASIVVRSGALNECIEDVGGGDLLAALASLEILAEVAESSRDAAAGLKGIDALSASLVRIASDRDADTALRTRAVVVGGRIAATCASDGDALAVEMMRLLGDLFADGERDIRAAVVDASGAMCVSNGQVADALVTTCANIIESMAYNALKGTGESQIIALHALANVCGAERSTDETLSAAAETTIIDACFAACGAKSLGDRIHDIVSVKSEHFLPARVGIYRLLSTLGKRRRVAEEIASHSELRRILCHEFEPITIASDHRTRALRALASADVTDRTARDDFARAADSPRFSTRPVAVPDVATATR